MNINSFTLKHKKIILKFVNNYIILANPNSLEFSTITSKSVS